MSIQYETGETGLRAVHKDYQEHALRVLWESDEGKNSRHIWVEVNKRISPETISRASIINFLESMRKKGVLSGVEKTGKGGHHWIYTPAMNEAEYKQHIAKTLIESLQKEFPAETRRTLKQL